MISEKDIDEIYSGIIDIRNSLQIPLQIRSLRRNFNLVESLKAIALDLEQIRLELMTVRRLGDDQPNDVLQKVELYLQKLVDRSDFRDVTAGMRLRQVHSPRENRVAELSDPDTSVADAALVILRRLREIIRDASNANEGGVKAAALRRLVPDQKLAPAMFEIVEGKIVIVRRAARAGTEDKFNVEEARTALVVGGERIIRALENSNCDRRILESMKELQSELARRDNIIRLGLMNIALDRVCKGAAAELPNAVLGAIEGQTAGIGMYVAQYPEWQRFSENAASVELTSSDIEQIGIAAQHTINQLLSKPDIADNEVPRTLRALRLLISEPELATKRAAFAVLRTLENLVARIFQYGADFLDKTAVKTIAGLSSSASHVIIAGLLSVALAATADLGGVTAKVAEASWMRSATEIVKAQLDEAMMKMLGR